MGSSSLWVLLVELEDETKLTWGLLLSSLEEEEVCIEHPTSEEWRWHDNLDASNSNKTWFLEAVLEHFGHRSCLT